MVQRLHHSFLFLLILGVLSACPRTSPPPTGNDAGVTPAPDAGQQGDGTPCGDLCAAVAECVPDNSIGVAASFAACKEACETNFDDGLKTCLTDASCEEIRQCFAPSSAEESCSAACDQVRACAAEDQAVLCDCESYTAEELECLATSDCGDLQGCAGEERQRCRAYCEKTAVCFPEAEEGFCEDICLVAIEPWVRECVIEQECAEAGACYEQVLDPCDTSCRVLSFCEEIPEANFETCKSDCRDRWTPSLRDCVTNAECDALANRSCGDLP